MNSAKVVSLLLIGLLVLCLEQKEVEADRCCADHPELGSCIPGRDDPPGSGGKCWEFCNSDCTKGGVCKRLGNGRHVCHCYC
ncbi:hypothetical protein U1Q18_018388 [Sarracenia purpurea var. burkii]